MSYTALVIWAFAERLGSKLIRVAQEIPVWRAIVRVLALLSTAAFDSGYGEAAYIAPIAARA